MNIRLFAYFITILTLVFGPQLFLFSASRTFRGANTSTAAATTKLGKSLIEIKDKYQAQIGLATKHISAIESNASLSTLPIKQALDEAKKLLDTLNISYLGSKNTGAGLRIIGLFPADYFTAQRSVIASLEARYKKLSQPLQKQDVSTPVSSSLVAPLASSSKSSRKPSTITKTPSYTPYIHSNRTLTRTRAEDNHQNSRRKVFSESPLQRKRPTVKPPKLTQKILLPRSPEPVRVVTEQPASVPVQASELDLLRQRFEKEQEEQKERIEKLKEEKTHLIRWAKEEQRRALEQQKQRIREEIEEKNDHYREERERTERRSRDFEATQREALEKLRQEKELAEQRARDLEARHKEALQKIEAHAQQEIRRAQELQARTHQEALQSKEVELVQLRQQLAEVEKERDHAHYDAYYATNPLYDENQNLKAQLAVLQKRVAEARTTIVRHTPVEAVQVKYMQQAQEIEDRKKASLARLERERSSRRNRFPQERTLVSAQAASPTRASSPEQRALAPSAVPQPVRLRLQGGPRPAPRQPLYQDQVFPFGLGTALLSKDYFNKTVANRLTSAEQAAIYTSSIAARAPVQSTPVLPAMPRAISPQRTPPPLPSAPPVLSTKDHTRMTITPTVARLRTPSPTRDADIRPTIKRERLAIKATAH